MLRQQSTSEPLSHCAIIEQLAAVSREMPSRQPSRTQKKDKRKMDCQPKSIHTEHFKRLKRMAGMVFNCIMHSAERFFNAA